MEDKMIGIFCTCDDCDHRKNNSTGGFCYMFEKHPQRYENSQPLDPCRQFVPEQKTNDAMITQRKS